MTRVKHCSRRKGPDDPGVIVVAGRIYHIDANGEVEVEPDHAAMMLQGDCWRKVQAVTKAIEPTAEELPMMADDMPKKVIQNQKKKKAPVNPEEG